MNIDGDESDHACARRGLAASMEPSMNIDGDTNSRRIYACLSTCFNGAVDEHRRRPRRSPTRAVNGIDASMEPSMNIDGDWISSSRLRSTRSASMEPSMNIDGDEDCVPA